MGVEDVVVGVTAELFVLELARIERDQRRGRKPGFAQRVVLELHSGASSIKRGQSGQERELIPHLAPFAGGRASRGRPYRPRPRP
jgi:hypothetical protein